MQVIGGRYQTRDEHTARLALVMAPGGAWVLTGGHEPEPVALGARARRQIDEALILGEFSPRERARLERARAGVLAGYWTDDPE